MISLGKYQSFDWIICVHWRAGPLFSRGAISSFSQKNAYFYDVLLQFSAKKKFLRGQLPPPPSPPSWPADVCVVFKKKKIDSAYEPDMRESLQILFYHKYAPFLLYDALSEEQ
jgi:hypothetical protein